MRERVGDDISLGLHLQPVVANRLRGAEGGLDIAHFQNLFHPLGVVCPDPGQKIGLQLQPDGKLVGFRLAPSALKGMDLVADPQQVLHVMADFVCDHVGLGKISRSFEFFSELLKEAKINIDLLIGRAVEGPDRCRRSATVGLHAIPEQDELRLDVLLVNALEDIVPNVFGVGQNGLDKICPLFFRGIARNRWPRLVRRGLLLLFCSRLSTCRGSAPRNVAMSTMIKVPIPPPIATPAGMPRLSSTFSLRRPSFQRMAILAKEQQTSD